MPQLPYPGRTPNKQVPQAPDAAQPPVAGAAPPPTQPASAYAGMLAGSADGRGGHQGQTRQAQQLSTAPQQPLTMEQLASRTGGKGQTRTDPGGQQAFGDGWSRQTTGIGRTDVPEKNWPRGPDQNDPNAMWAQMMTDHDAGLEGKLQGTYADEALAGRRMSEMNALGGGGVGGAFAGGAAQVGLGGMQQRLKTRNDHNKQGLEMKMARLTQLVKQAEASKDRNLQRELQAEMDKTQLALAGLAAGQDLPPGSEVDAGGGDPTSFRRTLNKYRPSEHQEANSDEQDAKYMQRMYGF